MALRSPPRHCRSCISQEYLLFVPPLRCPQMHGTCFLPCISTKVSHAVLFRWYQAQPFQSCHLRCRCFRCYEGHVPSSLSSTCFRQVLRLLCWALLHCLDRAFVSDIHTPSVLSCYSIDIQSLQLSLLSCDFAHL